MKKLFQRWFGKKRVSESTQKAESSHVSSVASKPTESSVPSKPTETSVLDGALGDDKKFYHWKDVVSEYPDFEKKCWEYVRQGGVFCDSALDVVTKLQSAPKLVLAHVKNGGWISRESRKIVLDYPNLSDIAIALAEKNYELPDAEILGTLIDRHIANVESVIQTCFEYHGKAPREDPLGESNKRNVYPGDMKMSDLVKKILKLSNAPQIMQMYAEYGGWIDKRDWDKILTLPNAESIFLTMIERKTCWHTACPTILKLKNAEKIMWAYIRSGEILSENVKKELIKFSFGVAMIEEYVRMRS